MATTTGLQTKEKKHPKQRADYYQIATNRIITLLEQGVPPWRKTWGSLGFARNYATGHVYRGINMLMLNFVAPYDIPLYMSRKQIKEKGGRIKKGAKAEWVYFYGDYHKDEHGKTVPSNEVEQRERDGETFQHIRFLKSRPVYNVSCVEGIDIEIPSMPVRDNSPIEVCDDFLRRLDPRPKYMELETDRACYHKVMDTITIPELRYFEASEEFYCTLFHEITHWTGHEKRLGRVGITSEEARFGTKLYSEEELIAEMGASYMCAMTGIDREAVTENSTAYIQSWMKQLREDKKLIFRVAARAQEAVDFLLPSSETK